MKKFFIIAGIILATLALGFFVLGIITSSPLSKSEADTAIKKSFEETIRGKPYENSASYLIVSESKNFKSGFKGKNGNAPYHIASIGKLFTAVAIARLIDEQLIKLETPIQDILGEKILEGLFIFDNKNYGNKITVTDLLSHTSGLADYFGDIGKNGESMMVEMIKNPHHLWTPEEIIAYAKKNTTSSFYPGTFHYSDTGYILLGLIIEKLRGKALHEVFKAEIFNPLNLQKTYMPFRSQFEEAEQPKIRPAFILNIDISNSQSISADWAGGGIASTEEDLLVFNKALYEGKLASLPTLSAMSEFAHEFMPGIKYGAGFMEYHFEDFFFLLADLPRLRGHMGILGTQLFFDPASKTHYIINLGADTATEDSAKLIIEFVSILKRVSP